MFIKPEYRELVGLFRVWTHARDYRGKGERRHESFPVERNEVWVFLSNICIVENSWEHRPAPKRRKLYHVVESQFRNFTDKFRVSRRLCIALRQSLRVCFACIWFMCLVAMLGGGSRWESLQNSSGGGCYRWDRAAVHTRRRQHGCCSCEAEQQLCKGLWPRRSRKGPQNHMASTVYSQGTCALTARLVQGARPLAA